MAQDPNNLIWIDLEMTGLDTQNDAILEIATVVTDAHLNIVAEGPVMAIRQAEDKLQGMDEWNRTQHTQSGLLQRVRASNVHESEAQLRTLSFLEQYVPPSRSPMCGNSICQDRRFLARCMPDLEKYFHYRNLDVSSLKELAVRWYPEVAQRFNKTSSHLALDDIRDSIRELQFYRETLFRGA